RDLLIEAGRDRSIELTLPTGAVVTGRVQTSDGQPAAGAVVTAVVTGPGSGHVDGKPWPVARAGADGRFRLPGLAAGEASVSATDHDRGASWSAVGTLHPGETREVTITVGNEASVAGTVRWDDGSPAAGVGVVAGWRL